VVVFAVAGCASMPQSQPEAESQPSITTIVDGARQVPTESADALLLTGVGGAGVGGNDFDGSERFEGTGVFINPGAVARREASPQDGDITFNFEGQGIQEVVHAIVHHILQENYVISPGVSGEVTFATARPLTRDQVMPVLEMLLRWNGATLVWREGKYHVLPIADAVSGNLVPRMDSLTASRGYEVMVVPLSYITPSRMAQVLEPYVRSDAIVNADDQRALLFIAGTRFELRNYMQIIRTFDVDWLAGMSVGLFSLNRIEVDELLPELQSVLGEDADTPLAGMFRFVPLTRLNAIMVITSNDHYLNQAERWIQRLDRSSPEAGSRLYVYRVKNLEADVLAGYLGQIFSGGSGRAAPTRRDRGDLAPGMERAQVSSVGDFRERLIQQGSGERRPSATADGDSLVIGDDDDVRISAITETNSLLIQASPSQYDAILSAINRLDEEPLQVLVEAQVLIVELNESLRYGVSWFLANRAAELGVDVQLPSGFGANRTQNALIFGAGTDVVGSITRRDLSRTFVAATIDALETVSNVRTISSPSLMVRNNVNANINVGRQVPVQSTSFITGSGEGSTIGNVQFISTGVTLNVTPRVNPGGLVYLQISQEVSSPGDAGVGGNPIINTRTINTEVAVQSGQTVLLGGLIEDTELEGKSGVPGLQRIPGLGAIFRSTRNSQDRTETLVLITPTVVESTDQLKALSDEVSRQFRGLQPLRVRTETDRPLD
jgi:general secretion pathway protein D